MWAVAAEILAVALREEREVVYRQVEAVVVQLLAEATEVLAVAREEPEEVHRRAAETGVVAVVVPRALVEAMGGATVAPAAVAR